MALSSSDVAAYAQYLNYAAARSWSLGQGTFGDEPNDYWKFFQDSPSSLDDLIFGDRYASGRGANINPYATLQNRDVLRSVAEKIGLTPEDADKAALDFAQVHLNGFGQGYTEATHPAIVADQIAQRLFQEAGLPYQGLTTEKAAQLANEAAAYQNNLKSGDENAWKRDDWGSLVAFGPEWAQYITEGIQKDPERAFLGAEDPLGTGIWNKVLGKDWDPAVNEVGGPTKGTYEQAQKQGIDTGTAAFLQQVADTTAKMIGGGYASQGIAEGVDASGIDPQYVQYAQDAKNYANYYKQYQNYKAGGEVNPGAVFTAATGGTKAIGDFDSSAFTGGDSPYNANSFFEGSQYGSNFAGGNVYDENGNWMDGEYDQYGNFVPADQTTFGDNYGLGSYGGQGNDIFGGGNLEQSNPELFGGTSGGLFSGLGGLFSGLTSNPSLGSLLSGGSGGNNLIALAPILAAIQHARQQGPYDTSRLTGLADQYSPDSMAYQYDRNTEAQRRSLTSSLADRGVAGSSFGNMDITNFNTNRELGRGALISQASLGGADIANKILQAQIANRTQQNQLYGSALYALGNVFGGKR